MKLWVDDVRPAPEGYIWTRSVYGAMDLIEKAETLNLEFKLLDLDHDAGDWACCGGDYIKLLDWLEMTGRNYPIHIHSMNPVGIQNMRVIIQKNGWEEV